jgi:DNA gyrase subunit A
MAIDSLRVMGRATQGVKLINLKKNDTIASIAKTPRNDDEKEQEGAEENQDQPTEGTDSPTNNGTDENNGAETENTEN